MIISPVFLSKGMEPNWAVVTSKRTMYVAWFVAWLFKVTYKVFYSMQEKQKVYRVPHSSMVCQAAHHRQVQGTPRWGSNIASAHRIRWERSLSSPQCPESPWKAFGAPLAWQNGPETPHLHNHLVLLPHSLPWDLLPPCKINQMFIARPVIGSCIGCWLL